MRERSYSSEQIIFFEQVSANYFYTTQCSHICLNRRRDYKAQPFLFPLSGVCKNTPCFLRADCCGSLKCAAVNGFYRITSRPVKLCVALSRLVTTLVGVPAATDKACCLFPYLARSGNLCTTFDRPFRAKNNSHAHRAGKCAKHFLLLETSAGQNLSRFFLLSLLALFILLLLPSFLTIVSHSLPLLFIPQSIPLSLSFLPPHFFLFSPQLFRGLLTPQPMTRC